MSTWCRASLILPLFIVIVGCTDLVFQPNHIHYNNPRELDKAFREVRITTPDGTLLRHWLFPASSPKGTVFFLHGNAQNVSSHANSVAWLPHHGFNVLLFEYRGFGSNSGHPDLDTTMQDITTTFHTIRKIPSIAGKPIILFGQSLGASIALYIASKPELKNHLCAVIAEAPFSDYRAIAQEVLAKSWLTWPLQYPLSWTIDDRYSPIKRIETIAPLPLVIIHSVDDTIIPYHHGQKLFTHAKEPKQIWKTEGHHIAFLKTKSGRKRFLDYVNATCVQ